MVVFGVDREVRVGGFEIVLRQESRFKLVLSHEEIAQMIGTSRETGTRVFSDLRKKQIIESKGSTMFIRNKAALKLLAAA